MPTLRKRIAAALEEEALDLRTISKIFGIKEREALDHLEHVAKSARLSIDPAHCNECGFSFKKRTRLSRPGRCPVCKSEYISPPLFRIAKPST